MSVINKEATYLLTYITVTTRKHTDVMVIDDLGTGAIATQFFQIPPSQFVLQSFKRAELYSKRFSLLLGPLSYRQLQGLSSPYTIPRDPTGEEPIRPSLRGRAPRFSMLLN